MKLKLTSDPKSMIVYNGEMLIATFYHGHDIKNEVCRRTNAYDKLKEKLKDIKQMIDEPNTLGEGDLKVKLQDLSDLISKTLKEI